MHWIKAKLSLAIIATIWGRLIIRDAFSLIAAYRHDKNTGKVMRHGRFHSILIGQDIYVNTLLGGYYRTTISSELGNQSKTSKSGTMAASVVDWLFELAGDPPNHCVDAIEAEDKHWFNASAALTGFLMWLLGGIVRLSLRIGLTVAVLHYFIEVIKL